MKRGLQSIQLRTLIDWLRLLPALFLLATTASAPAGDFSYGINPLDTNTITITGYTGAGGSVAIPSIIDGRTVTSIGDMAFYGCASLTNVTIPDSVTSIRAAAFQVCTNLAGVTLGNGVASIGRQAFQVCTRLASVTIPAGVTSIGLGAFSYCPSMTGITVNASNSFYCSLGGILFNNSRTVLVAYPGGMAGSYAIPSGVTNIGDWAFYFCPGLTSVTMGNDVIIVGSGAFDSCASLTSAMIGNGVTSIGGGAFQQCTNLASITLGNSVAYVGDYAFDDCARLASVTIPNSVTNIGDWAFQRCTNMNNVSIGNGVVRIGGGAFAYCTRLSSVTIPASVTSIGGSTFYGCTGLTGVTIGAGLARIEDSAFSGCTSLTGVTIPSNVTSIGGYAFDACSSLVSVTIPAGVTSIGECAFQYCTRLADVTIPASVTSIGNAAFYGCTSLASATIGKGVAGGEGVAFNFRASLTGVTSIGIDAFRSCTNLARVTIGENVAGIGGSAFASCTRLTGAYFLGNAPSLGSGVFDSDDNATVYYLAGTTGWGPTFGGRPTALWTIPPEIITDPQSLIRNAGESASFIVSAAGTAPLNYQWQRNSANIGLANSATCMIVSVATGDAGNYRCIVSNLIGAVTSAVATLTVNVVLPPSAPTGVQASDGAYTDKVAVTWSAAAGAGGYQVWRAGENNIGSAVNLGNAIGLSYNDNSSAVRSATMFYYWVKAWNSMGTSDFSKVDGGFCRMSENPEIISGQPMVGDYDGDNKADPAVYNLANGRLFAWLSSAAYTLVTPVATFLMAVGDLPVVNDFDGDRLADPGVFQRLTGSWYIWLSSAGYFRVGPLQFGVDINDMPIPADYDGDRLADPAVCNAGDKWYVWLSSAGYFRVGPLTTFFVDAADTPTPGQFDADALADPAVYQATAPSTASTSSPQTGSPLRDDVSSGQAGQGGNWYVWLSSAGYYRIGPIPLGTTGEYRAVPADYDGDKLCDPAAYVPTNGVWRIWESGNGYALKELPLR